MGYPGDPQDLGALIARYGERIRRLEAALPITGPQGPPGPQGLQGPSGAASTAPVVQLAEIPVAPTSPAAFVTFSPIPTYFRHLWIDWKARGDTAAGNVTVLIRLNGDTGADYDDNRASITGVTQTNVEGIATSTGAVMGIMAAASAPTYSAGGGRIYIPWYGDTLTEKLILGWAVSKTSTTSGGTNQEHYGAFWRQTPPVAITSVTLLPGAGNFATGLFSLYAEP